jgi:hypothetical protein
MIYEGTNGIQALDLIGRKLSAHMGRYLRSFFHPVSTYRGECRGRADRTLRHRAEARFRGFAGLHRDHRPGGLKDPEEAGAAATDYLRQLGLTALAYCFRAVGEDRRAEAFPARRKGVLSGQITTARFFYDRIPPQTAACYLAIKSGKGSMMALDEALF